MVQASSLKVFQVAGTFLPGHLAHPDIHVPPPKLSPPMQYAKHQLDFSKRFDQVSGMQRRPLYKLETLVEC
jgi:hypothetical protein